MKQALDWNDLRMFLVIAQHGGLRAAATELSMSPSTLSRRMTAFEQALNKKLFERGAKGYSLSAEGILLKEIAADTGLAVIAVERWIACSDTVRRVKISAGDWTMSVILERLSDFQSIEDSWSPDFIGSNIRLDIARREVDIGIRNKRPAEPWLAGRQFGNIDYAIYQSKNHDGDLPFIGSFEDGSTSPTQKWVKSKFANNISARVSSPHMGLGLVERGIGKMVLPRFIGDRNHALVATSESIEELQTEQWLVVHQDERGHPPVRGALDAVSGVLEKYIKSI